VVVLNTRGESIEPRLQRLRVSYEAEVKQIVQDAARKIDCYKRGVEQWSQACQKLQEGIDEVIDQERAAAEELVSKVTSWRPEIPEMWDQRACGMLKLRLREHIQIVNNEIAALRGKLSSECADIEVVQRRELDEIRASSAALIQRMKEDHEEAEQQLARKRLAEFQETKTRLESLVHRTRETEQAKTREDLTHHDASMAVENDVWEEEANKLREVSAQRKAEADAAREHYEGLQRRLEGLSEHMQQLKQRCRDAQKRADQGHDEKIRLDNDNRQLRRRGEGDKQGRAPGVAPGGGSAQITAVAAEVAAVERREQELLREKQRVSDRIASMDRRN